MNHKSVTNGVPVTTSIASIQPGMKNLLLECIVVQIFENAKKTREGGEVISFIVADQSGSIVLSLWDEIGKAVLPGYILQLKTAYANLFQNRMRLYVPKFGSVKKIGDFMMLFSDLPNVSNYEWTIDPNNPNKFIVKKSSPTDSSSTNRKNNVNKN